MGGYLLYSSITPGCICREKILMVKVSDIDEEEEENWRFSTGLTKKAAKNTFCFDCHAAALNDDIVFTNGDFFKSK